MRRPLARVRTIGGGGSHRFRPPNDVVVVHFELRRVEVAGPRGDATQLRVKEVTAAGQFEPKGGRAQLLRHRSGRPARALVEYALSGLAACSQRTSPS